MRFCGKRILIAGSTAVTYWNGSGIPFFGAHESCGRSVSVSSSALGGNRYARCARCSGSVLFCAVPRPAFSCDGVPDRLAFSARVAARRPSLVRDGTALRGICEFVADEVDEVDADDDTPFVEDDVEPFARFGLMLLADETPAVAPLVPHGPDAVVAGPAGSVDTIAADPFADSTSAAEAASCLFR